LASFLVKRLGLRQKLQRSARRSFQVLDVLPLGRSQRLCVVRCYDRTFLIGLGDKELCSISELDQAVVDNDLAKEPTSPRTAARPFGDWLAPLLRPAGNAPAAAAPAPAAAAASAATRAEGERATRQRVAQDLLARLEQELPELELASQRPAAPPRPREASSLGRGGLLG
jgi:flagellar biogenesis protein FliO